MQQSTPASTGVVAEGCKESGNLRTYPLQLLQQQVQALISRMLTKPLLGELLHPPADQSTFWDPCPACASHQVMAASFPALATSPSMPGCCC